MNCFLIHYLITIRYQKRLILALRYLDETQPVMKIDDPTSTKNKQDIYLEALDDSSGYFMDYDLMTDGELNDLTLQVEFIKKKMDMPTS